MWTNIQGRVVNPWRYTTQGQPITKPETPLQIILVGNVNLIGKGSMAKSPIQYSHRGYKDINVW